MTRHRGKGFSADAIHLPRFTEEELRAMARDFYIRGWDATAPGGSVHLLIIGELQRQIDEITGYVPPQPLEKTMEEMRVEMAQLRATIDNLKKETTA